MNQVIKVLLADDHPMFLEGVRNAIQKYSDIEVVAECTDGEAALEQMTRQVIDVAVLDINMPGKNGIHLAKQLAREFPHTRVVFLTMYHPSAVGQETINAHFAHGYVLKNSGSAVLSEAIRSVHSGGRYLDPKLEGVITPAAPDDSTESIRLSKREKEIIRLVAEGKGNREIAAELFLSELTIKTHRKNIYQKLGVNNVAGLIQKVGFLEL